MTSKHEAAWEWLKACPHIQDMFFNSARTDRGNTELIPSETVLEEYTDGSSLRSYDCALARFMPISLEPNDEANIEDLIDFDLVSDWVEEQNANGNFPEFPAGQSVQEITVSPNDSGYMAMLEVGIAKYMIQFRISYLKEPKQKG